MGMFGKSIGKKLMSAVTAAAVFLTGFGGIKLTDLKASAAGSIVYDAGTFKADKNCGMTDIKTVLSDPATIGGKKMTLKDTASGNIKLNIADKEVAFAENVDYSYVAKGEVNNGKVNWTINAWPSERKATGSSVTSAQASSGFSAWFNDAAPRWTQDSWRNGGKLNNSIEALSGDGSTNRDAWIVLKTTPFHEAYNSQTANTGKVTIQINTHDQLNTVSQPDSWTFGEGEEEEILALSRDHGKILNFADLYNGVDINSATETTTKKFDQLITTSGTSNSRKTVVPTFAIPSMIRTVWLDSLYDVMADDQAKARQDLTGIRLDNMVARSYYDETTLPRHEWKSHVYEFSDDSDVTQAYLDGLKDTKKPNGGLISNFGVNDDNYTPIKLANASGQSITYSEVPTKLIFSKDYASQLSKVSIGKNKQEVCDTRVSMTTKVNVTWSYSTDYPRLTGSTSGDAPVADAPSSGSTHIWDGTADTSWYTGDKESYDISTPEQLAGLAKLTHGGNAFKGIIVNLVNDIALNDTTKWRDWVKNPPKNSEWQPIGDNTRGMLHGFTPFSGIFNGNGHTISGFYMKNSSSGFLGLREDPPAMFGYTSGAIICDLKMEKCVSLGEGLSLEAAILTLESENDVIKNVEIKDSIVGVSGKQTGAIAGDVSKVDYSVLFTNLMLAAAGVFVNPIFYLDQIKKYEGSVIDSCKVSNVEFINTGHAGTMEAGEQSGGMVGFMNGGAVLNSVTENVYFDLSHMTYAHSNGDKCGAIAGITNNTLIENCYTYNCKTARNRKLTDSDAVPAVSKQEYLSSAFVAKLGECFESDPNGMPILKVFKNSILSEKVLAGDFDNNELLNVTDVLSAIDVYLNGNALDYRSFKAIDVDNSGSIDVKDITMMINLYLNS